MGSIQALIIGKSLNPSKFPYLDHYGLVEIKKIALEIINFEIPLIQVYSIRGRAIVGSVQALIIVKSLNPSKLPYLDHYGLIKRKHFALEIITFEIPLIQV